MQLIRIFSLRHEVAGFCSCQCGGGTEYQLTEHAWNGRLYIPVVSQSSYPNVKIAFSSVGNRQLRQVYLLDTYPAQDQPSVQHILYEPAIHRI